jgi:hypothetical protein
MSAASEAACQPNGVGCVVPPRGARFYPFFALTSNPTCALLFGNFSGRGIDNFGGDAQYGAPNLVHYFGQNTSGPVTNPCTP